MLQYDFFNATLTVHPYLDAYAGKTVLVTGHTGFKGSWLISWLHSLGANIIGVSNSVPQGCSLYSDIRDNIQHIDLRIDLSDNVLLVDLLNEYKPDFIFHLAAQAFVPLSYKQPVETWRSNVLGTINLLESLRLTSLDTSCVFITSDKCYSNKEWIWGYRENDTLGGSDPYSASKASAEIAINSYCESFFSKSSITKIARARAGNVIGGGDWSPNRLIPDCARSWLSQDTMLLRSPSGVRPWQHVLEALNGYLLLAYSLKQDTSLHSHAFNFGPVRSSCVSVSYIAQKLSSLWPNFTYTSSKTTSEIHETMLLSLNTDKAFSKLNWLPHLDIDQTISLTASWYSAVHTSRISPYLAVLSDIENYTSLISEHGK